MAVYDEGFAPTADESRFSNVMNYAGAALSLALIVGVGFWGYKLVVRDVSGIPVVRAMEGDMRVLPDNPGGAVALHTGLAVNEVAASGEAAGPEDVLYLAPAESGLAAEDLEVQLAPAASEILEAVAEADATAGIEETVTAVAAATEEVDEIALLAQMLATGTATPPPAAGLVDASVPGLRNSLRPMIRPAALTVTRAAPAQTGGSEVAVTTVAFPPGTHLVHLGAYPSPAEAAAAWDRLSARLSQYLSGYDRVIQISNQSGGTWYRLRASGFADRAEARRLCAVLQAEFAECIAVVTD
ncbi:SPOR domain-containing protein [Yoonia litorea]|uniref:Cell division protein DedD (Protein involved in septation) n=1 Tax=Yoonia litorea TaxID=1123755 RepID=A0A1I6LZ41_9RHOB|nr:SPOR domain-containing protein [Yoonia litorea]SFS08739.1 Cell division protein DedD (protein involved in septation) [Yoonia litorea]